MKSPCSVPILEGTVAAPPQIQALPAHLADRLERHPDAPGGRRAGLHGQALGVAAWEGQRGTWWLSHPSEKISVGVIHYHPLITGVITYKKYPLVNVYITMEIQHFEWVNRLFLWPFSIANC